MFRLEDVSVTVQGWEHWWRVSLVYGDDTITSFSCIPRCTHLSPKREGDEPSKLRDEISSVEIDVRKGRIWCEVRFQGGVYKDHSPNLNFLRDHVGEGGPIRVPHENIVFLDEYGHGRGKPAVQPSH